MKPFPQFYLFLAVFLLFACITPGGSAFTVSSVTVDPPGFQLAGTPMTVNTVIHFYSGPTGNFPKENELLLSTDLVDPHWVPVLILDGVETHMDVTSGDELTIPGWYLSYPPSQKVELVVKLTGNIPSNRKTGENLVEMQERDAAKTVVSSAHIAMQEVPLETQVTQTTPTKKSTTIKVFTPLATDTTPASPVGTGVVILAVTGVALFVMKRQ
jgi:hypothetical protein